jgi:trehalose 6-phosphate phosphatase
VAHKLQGGLTGAVGNQLPSAGDLSRWAFLLDIDGTLLDIAPSPAEVVMPEGLIATLTALQQASGGALALVSGRPLADIDRIFAPLVLPAIGGHGAESRPQVTQPELRQSAELDRELRQQLAAIAALDPRILVEDKGYALALHFRRAPQQQPALEAAVMEVCSRKSWGSLEILPGKAVLEIKSTSFNKGSAICCLMRFAPFAGRRPIFIGDDTTDESALSVMDEFAGVGLSVGRVLPGVIGHFGLPEELRHWLAQLVRPRELAAR